MQTEVIMVGSGGQGILLMGSLLAQAAMKSGKHVTWFPSYGAEKRGGISHSTVVISEEEIASPIVASPQTIILMDNLGFDLYVPRVRTKGCIFVNTSLIKKEISRKDVEIIKIPANKLAEEIGNTKVTNIVALGAYIKKSGVLPLQSVIDTLKDVISKKNQSLLVINEEALKRGAASV